MAETNKKMNLKQKILKCRVDVQGEIKKATQGYGYSYFSNDDILPVANDVLFNNGVYTEFNIISKDKLTENMIIFEPEKGTEKETKKIEYDYWGVLTVEDTDSDEKREYATPTCLASVKGASAIQNFGAMATFTKRYLFLNFLQIADGNDKEVEKSSDSEKKANEKVEKKGNKAPLATKEQVALINEKAGDDLKEILNFYKVENVESMTCVQASDCLKRLN